MKRGKGRKGERGKRRRGDSEKRRRGGIMDSERTFQSV